MAIAGSVRFFSGFLCVVIFCFAGVGVPLFFAVLPIGQTELGAGRPYGTGGGVGFGEGTEEEAAQVLAWFQSIPKADSIRNHLIELTKAPHIAGTVEDEDQVVWMKELWESYGIPDVALTEYEVLLSYPISSSLKMTNNEVNTGSPREISYAQDPTSDDPRITIGFHGYSAAGNATGPLVYINYCTEGDFDLAASKGIDVSGAIVLCRYGRVFRGNKVQSAEVRGAVGVLIYSDPYGDGYANGVEFPNGPWRPERGIQRGTVGLGEGDPLTPGWPSVVGSRRLTLEQARDPEVVGAVALPKIPSFPLSWGDAEPYLARLKGMAVATVSPNGGWQGSLPFPYFVGETSGPDAVLVEMVNENEYVSTSVWNVVGTIAGADEPDRTVVLGNHHDAWVFGAVDPSSGSATLNDVARALGTMVSEGWKPSRTIQLCSWDAEEYGLVGSVEWVEEFASMLSAQAVAYLNVDIAVNGMGPMAAGGTPQLASLMRDVAKTLPQPDTMGDLAYENESIYDYWLRSDQAYYSSMDVTETVVTTLGSGSDFTGFICHIGVPSVSIEWAGDYYGVYHSAYDSFYWMDTFGDPGFKYHESMAKYWGSLALRLANDRVLPFNYIEYATEMRKYVDAIGANIILAGAPSELVNQPLERLRAAVDLFDTAASVVTQQQAYYKDRQDATLAIRGLNDRLMLAERAFLIPEGISKTRAWFKHAVFSPGEFDNYASETFPAVTDALYIDAWEEAAIAIDAAGRVVHAAAKVLMGSMTQ